MVNHNNPNKIVIREMYQTNAVLKFHNYLAVTGPMGLFITLSVCIGQCSVLVDVSENTENHLSYDVDNASCNHDLH